MKDALYRCDPSKNTECNKSGCYLKGGPCKWTTHEAFAVTFNDSSNDLLQIMLSMQQNLQEQLGYNFATMNAKERVDYIKEYVLHCEDELHEMLRELPYFKPWKKYPEDLTVIANMLNNSKEEWIDVLHFFLNISLALGFSAQELFELYCVKNGINYNRQLDQDNYKKCKEV